MSDAVKTVPLPEEVQLRILKREHARAKNDLTKIRDFCKDQIAFREGKGWGVSQFEELLALAQDYFAFSSDTRAVEKRAFLATRGSGLENFMD